MDALILSCGTGGGHDTAGVAVKEELERRGDHVTMLNPYDLYGSKLAVRVDKTYITVAQRAPKAFGAIYNAGRLYRRFPWRSPVYYTNGHMADILDAYLKEHPVDVIIMPHIFPAEILTFMRDHGMTVPKTILIATDYTCVPFEEECICDAYVIPSADLKGEFVKRGVPAERVYPLGIPVRKDFLLSLSCEEAKRKLNLPLDKRYILVAGGSIGAGKMEKALDILCEITKGTSFRLIVICGSNETVYQNLKKSHGDDVILIGRTEQMAVYLRACELYFTKPGGLSTTEAAVMEVPMALLPPIPGCESRNLRFYTENGMAAAAELSAKGLRKILNLLDSVSDCEQMLQCQRNVIPKDAAKRICDLAYELTDKKTYL